MLLALAILAASPVPPGGVPGHSDGRCRLTRSRMDRTCGDGAPAFEFAPASGAGMGTACACATVTGSRGESLGFNRATVGYCTKGPVNTGIAVGDMVQCAVNQPRVGAGDGSGILGLLTEGVSTNVLVRSEEIENAAWTSTATVAANAATSPANTATADQLSDVSAVAIQTSCQTLPTVSLTADAAGIFVRAGTATGATITMTGTGNSVGDCSANVSGLSSTTWTRLQCGSVAAYTAGLTAVTVCVGVGVAAGDTGTIMVWGAQLEQVGASVAAVMSSYIATTTVGVVRNSDNTSLSPSLISGIANAGSMAVTYVLQWAPGMGPGAQGAGFAAGGGASRFLYLGSAGSVRVFDGTNEIIRAQTPIQFTARRAGSQWSGSTLISKDITGGTQSSGAFASMNTSAFTIGVVGGIGQVYGVIKQLCISRDPTRCV